MPSDWTTSHLECSFPERKAYAFKLLLEKMPVAIDDDELFVGWKTLGGPKKEGITKIENPSEDVSCHCFPSYLTDAEREAAALNKGLRGGEGGSKGHAVGGYAKVLRYGFGGIRRLADERLAVETNQEKVDFLRAVKIAYEGASALAKRYADIAAKMAEKAAEPRKAELLRIAGVCNKITDDPPESLQEALQIYWFTHLILLVENGTLMSFGRFDQIIDDFWDTCPEPEARELLACFMIKLNDQADMIAKHSGIDNLMIAGLKPDGTEGTNAVTYACLDVVEELNLEQPMLAVRLHKNSPDKLWRRVTAALRKVSGQIAIYNDDTFIPALNGAGIPIEYARNYALDACQDILIDGCSDFYVAGTISMTDLLLETLEQEDAEQLISFAAFENSYKRKIADAVGRVAERYDTRLRCRNASPTLFLSGSMEGCIENGVDVTEDGCRFRDKGVVIGTPVNAVNGLAALKKVVYEEGIASLKEVIQGCRENFKQDEKLRRQLLAAPKWGNDDDAVDLVGKEILEFACRQVQDYRIDEQARFLSGIHQPHHVRHGDRIGATPDGRRSGEPVPVTLSPANGTDKHGPTAVMKSVTKINPLDCQWNHALLLSFDPRTLEGDDGLAKFEALLRTYIGMKGPQLELNVVDAEKLKAAQKNPELHTDLIVRVWGFCARFIDLTKEYQDDLIRRTVHMI